MPNPTLTPVKVLDVPDGATIRFTRDDADLTVGVVTDARPPAPGVYRDLTDERLDTDDPNRIRRVAFYPTSTAYLVS